MCIRDSICDMDGVIYHGNQILPGVPEFIQWLHDEKKEYCLLYTSVGRKFGMSGKTVSTTATYNQRTTFVFEIHM